LPVWSWTRSPMVTYSGSGATGRPTAACQPQPGFVGMQ
jgi:hypothetical protein